MPPYLSDVLNTFVTEDHLFIATVVFYHKAADIARNFSTAILPCISSATLLHHHSTFYSIPNSITTGS